jgi:hypothetical protein
MNAKKNTFIIKSQLSILNAMLCKSPVVPNVNVPFSDADLTGVQSCAALLSVSARVYSNQLYLCSYHRITDWAVL